MHKVSRRNVTWRYLDGRLVKHALSINGGLTGHATVALCGVAPPGVFPQAVDWCGTGSQAEYDNVARLAECGNCARMLKPEEAATNG